MNKEVSNAAIRDLAMCLVLKIEDCQNDPTYRTGYVQPDCEFELVNLRRALGLDKPGFGPSQKLEIEHPCISVNRSSKRISIFDQFKQVTAFVSYDNEERAIALAKEWIGMNTAKEPQVMFVAVNSMTAA